MRLKNLRRTGTPRRFLNRPSPSSGTFTAGSPITVGLLLSRRRFDRRSDLQPRPDDSVTALTWGGGNGKSPSGQNPGFWDTVSGGIPGGHR